MGISTDPGPPWMYIRIGFALSDPRILITCRAPPSVTILVSLTPFGVTIFWMLAIIARAASYCPAFAAAGRFAFSAPLALVENAQVIEDSAKIKAKFDSRLFNCTVRLLTTQDAEFASKSSL